MKNQSTLSTYTAIGLTALSMPALPGCGRDQPNYTERARDALVLLDKHNSIIATESDIIRRYMAGDPAVDEQRCSEALTQIRQLSYDTEWYVRKVGEGAGAARREALGEPIKLTEQAARNR